LVEYTCKQELFHAFNSVQIFDCYSGPLGWKQKIQNQQHQVHNIKQLSINKENIKVFINGKDLKMLMHSTIELGGCIIHCRFFFLFDESSFSFYVYLFITWISWFEGKGRRYFYIAIDWVRTKYFLWSICVWK
jgi:hypothetical protein